jgi:hypothetical protein
MSEVKTDKLTGTSTAGSILVTGEGNSTTTNLQQGLAKAWGYILADGTGYNDSFNTSGTTDTGAGETEVAFTNNMNNAVYATNATNNNFGSTNRTAGTKNLSMSGFRCSTGSGSSNSFVDYLRSFAVHGDLA